MKVGIIGLGKLGMPVALAMSLKGHDVMGYDINPERMQKDHFSEQERGPNGEASIEPLLRQSSLQFGSLWQVVAHSEIVFVAIQTPHESLYEGVTRLPDTRVDFDYTYLKSAMHELSAAVRAFGREMTVVLISTVLPGTLRREVIPNISPLIRLCYNPFFIAMGTTIEDFLHPEFVLFGVDEQNYAAALDVAEFYRTLHNAPFYETSIENAELIKVAYNTFISMKICFVNTLMEVCHKTPGCNVDEVTDAFQFATKRLLSMKYLRGGMGDGGGCHPRDNIAMSWLAREKGLSYDFFESIMKCREQQTDWLCHLVEVERVKNGYDKRVGIYGMSFKPETNLIVGSPARLLKTLFEERGYEVFQYDPHVHKQYSFEDKAYMPSDLKLFVVATQHDVYKTLNFPEGSVVIDPFRYMPDINGVKVIHVGRGNN